MKCRAKTNVWYPVGKWERKKQYLLTRLCLFVDANIFLQAWAFSHPSRQADAANVDSYRSLSPFSTLRCHWQCPATLSFLTTKWSLHKSANKLVGHVRIRYLFECIFTDVNLRVVFTEKIWYGLHMIRFGSHMIWYGFHKNLFIWIPYDVICGPYGFS